jgi:hypothetical protein
VILKRIFAPLFTKARDAADKGSMVSIVLLLREPNTYLQWELAAAVERSFGSSEQHGVTVQGPLAFLRIESHFIQVICGSRPYWDSETSRKKIQPAWAKHEGFIAVDDMDKNLDSKVRYAVVARLVLALLTDNCVAAYSPEIGGLVPSDEGLTERLRALAGSYGGNC